MRWLLDLSMVTVGERIRSWWAKAGPAVSPPRPRREVSKEAQMVLRLMLTVVVLFLFLAATGPKSPRAY